MVDINLCQPDSTKSCAACCGIYNYVDNTRDSLERRLTIRTQLFSRVREETLALEDYRATIRRRENAKRIYTTIYTCEFVGFLDEGLKRVGCMLHPLMNKGNDLRVASFYGREICEGHFCPSFQKLDEHEAGILAAALTDWYLYGSVITDIDFVKTFITIIQNRIGEALDVKKVRLRSALKEVIRRYCALKQDWPFRDTTRPRFGKYYFVGEDYDIAHIDYASLGAQASPYDAIFVSLSSLFKDKEQLDNAGRMIDALIEDFYHAYATDDG